MADAERHLTEAEGRRHARNASRSDAGGHSAFAAQAFIGAWNSCRL
jgi:hypothetical protein